MAMKVIGRRPLLNNDNLYYMCEICRDCYYPIPPYDKLGTGAKSYEECVKGYIEHIVVNAVLEPIKVLDNLFTVASDLDETGKTTANYLINFFDQRIIFVDKQAFDVEKVCKMLIDDRRGIIY